LPIAIAFVASIIVMSIYALDKLDIIKLPRVKKMRVNLTKKKEFKRTKKYRIEMSNYNKEDTISLDSYETKEKRLSYRMV
jgi:hypothetical protein